MTTLEDIVITLSYKTKDILDGLPEQIGTPLKRELDDRMDNLATPVVKLLLVHGERVNAVNMDDTSPVYAAAGSGSVEIMKLLLAHGANLNTPRKLGALSLQRAVGYQKPAMVRFLCEKGCPVNTKMGHRNETPLHRSVAESLEITNILLAFGADVRATDKYGDTPLHTAVYYCNPDTVKALLAHGAPVNAKNNEGKTPLQMLSDSPDNHKEVMKITAYLKAAGGR